MPRYTYGPDVKARVKRLFEALLNFANWEFDECGFDIQVNWQAEDSANPKLIVRTTLADLYWLTKKDNYPGELTKPRIREALNILKDFLKILEDNRTKTQGVHTWHFTLTLWSKDKEKNLQQFGQAWEDSRPDKSKALEATFKKSSDSAEALQDEIDWRDVCLAMLEKQKRLTTNELLSADEDMKFELDDIHVPLALVQRTKPDKRSGDVSPEEGSRLLQPSYEEKQRFRHEEFLAQVLQEGKGQSKGRRIAVIGEPGAGKTTLLQSIAFWLFEDKNKNLGLPIWISLADLQGKTLEEYLLQRWLKNALEVARVTPEQENALVELFKQERVWLFLDGVDEIAGSSVGVGAHSCAPLQMIASQLEGWVAKARMVLSCRLNVWEANINALGDDFDTYRLLDFDYPLQVKEFICRWFRKTDADKGARLWTELDKSERQRIQDLVKNPLRLALLCSTWQSSDKGLPSTKAGLYERFVEVFYTWKENRFHTTPKQRQELNAGLGRLALRAIDSEESRFRLRHKVVCEVLGDPEQENSLFGLALQLGWLNQVGLAAESETQEKVYAFYHPTFQEYFAALAINDRHEFLNHVPHNPAQGIYRIFEPQWKEVFLLWLGREEVAQEQKEEFIWALRTFDDGCGRWYGYRAFFLTAVGIAEFSDCPWTDEIVAQIAKWGFGYFNHQKQKWQYFREPIAKGTRAILPEMPYPLVMPRLMEVIGGEDAGGIAGSDAVSILLEIAKANPEAIAALINLIRTSEDESIRWRATQGLGEIALDNSKAIATLIDLCTEPSELIRFQAAESLGKIYSKNSEAIDLNNSKVINLLIEAICTIEDPGCGLDMASILGEMGRSNPEAVRALIKLIRNSADEGTLFQAVYGLGKIGMGDPDAITALVELIWNCDDDIICQLAAESLGKIDPNHPNASTCVEHQFDPTWMVAETLGTIDPQSPDAIPTLISKLRDGHDCWTVAESSKRILQSHQMQSIVSALKDCLTHQVYENNCDLYNSCYELIWHCAQNMTYPAFYQAWHQQEAVGKTTTSDSQSLNQADLPQSLQSAIAKDPQLSQTIHLICIDGSQFIERDRPAAEIYDQMLDQNCRECDPVPETMPALKLYWNSLKRNSDKRMVLVFYASSTDATPDKDTALPCPYSEAFLTVLSKFGREICVITEQRFDHIRLQFFAPSQAIADVVQWIREMVVVE